jgi:flagellar biosynthesis regulator FlaF
MWTRIFNSKVFDRLFTVALALLIFVLGQAALGKKEDKSILRQEINSMAKKEYVDSQDNTTRKLIEDTKKDMQENDKQLKEDLKNSVIEININLREVRNYILKRDK